MIMFGAIATTLVYAPTGLMAMILEMMITFKRMINMVVIMMTT